MNRCLALAILGTTLLVSAAARAQDDELSRIPQAGVQAEANGPAGSADRTIFLQNDVIVSGLRSGLAVAFPPPSPPGWEERLFLDARLRWHLADNLSLVYSGRLNLRDEQGLDFPGHEDIRHDFREGYLAWMPTDGVFLDLGRINEKNGVALGFNPTDFFKTRAVVEPLSADPSALREDRLGTFMLRAQRIWPDGALTLVVAPKLANESAIYTNTNLPVLDPMFDRTNAHTRILLKGSYDLSEDFAPELLVYNEAGRTVFGANVTRGIGQSIVAYLEWAGGDRASLADMALDYGRATGTIPLRAPDPFPTSDARPFQNDLAAGASYTTDSRITFNLEYHFHQAGFSDADWQNWFGAGALHIPALDRELWYIRGYAADRQEPLARHSVFLRFDRQDAFVSDLELSGFVNTDLRDGSSFLQLTADYYLSGAWTIGGILSANLGARHSEFGSLPGETSALFKISRYL